MNSAFPDDAMPNRRCVPVSHGSSTGTVEFFGVEIEQPDATDYVLGYDSPIGGRIAELRITSSAGSGRVSVLINDIVVDGLDNVVVASGARASFSAEGDNIFAPGDDIVLRVENGSVDLLGLKATVVVSNRSQSRSWDTCDAEGKLVAGVIPIVDNLIGLDVIPIEISPELKRKPFHVFVSHLEKQSPEEDDIFQVSVGPITEAGWDVYLSSPAIANQILHYAYIT